MRFVVSEVAFVAQLPETGLTIHHKSGVLGTLSWHLGNDLRLQDLSARRGFGGCLRLGSPSSTTAKSAECDTKSSVIQPYLSEDVSPCMASQQY